MEDMKTEGAGWLDSAALAECRRLTAENAALAERNAELRAALDEQGDELARVRREAASVPTELESGRLLIVADSIASDGEGLRTIEAYGRFFEREAERSTCELVADLQEDKRKRTGFRLNGIRCSVCGERHSGVVNFTKDGSHVVLREEQDEYCRHCGSKITNDVDEIIAEYAEKLRGGAAR